MIIFVVQQATAGAPTTVSSIVDFGALGFFDLVSRSEGKVVSRFWKALAGYRRPCTLAVLRRLLLASILHL